MKKWKFSFMKKYYFMDNKSSYQGSEILMLYTPIFQIKWFTDCGDWFVYLVFGKSKKWIRFSSCGTLSNFIKRWY